MACSFGFPAFQPFCHLAVAWCQSYGAPALRESRFESNQEERKLGTTKTNQMNLEKGRSTRFDTVTSKPNALSTNDAEENHFTTNKRKGAQDIGVPKNGRYATAMRANYPCTWQVFPSLPDLGNESCYVPSGPARACVSAPKAGDGTRRQERAQSVLSPRLPPGWTSSISHPPERILTFGDFVARSMPTLPRLGTWEFGSI